MPTSDFKISAMACCGWSIVLAWHRDENDLLRAEPLDDHPGSWRRTSDVLEHGDLGTIPGLIFGTAFLVGGHDRASRVRGRHRRRGARRAMRRAVRRTRHAAERAPRAG